jgi:hypothetical protein
MEMFMDEFHHKRNTYTLPQPIIEYINKYSGYLNLSKSKFISYSINYTFGFMEIELEEMRENGNTTLYQKVSKKQTDVNPITVTLPLWVTDKLNYYCKELDVKKSHMIRCSVIIFIEDLHKKYGDNIDGLMVSEE